MVWLATGIDSGGHGYNLGIFSSSELARDAIEKHVANDTNIRERWVDEEWKHSVGEWLRMATIYHWSVEPFMLDQVRYT